MTAFPIKEGFSAMIGSLVIFSLTRLLMTQRQPYSSAGSHPLTVLSLTGLNCLQAVQASRKLSFLGDCCVAPISTVSALYYGSLYQHDLSDILSSFQSLSECVHPSTPVSLPLSEPIMSSTRKHFHSSYDGNELREVRELRLSSSGTKRW